MNMEKANLTFEKIVLILKKGLLWILVSGVILGCVAGICGQFLIEDEYTSKLLVRLDTKDASSATLQRLDYHVESMVMILKTRFVVERAVEKAGVQIGGKTDPAVSVMMSATTVTGNSENGSIVISVTSTNAGASFQMIRAYAELLPEIIYEKGLQPVDILDLPAEAPSAPSNSGRAIEYGFLGFAAGVILACVFLVIRAMFDVIIRTEDDLQEIVEFPVLGQIPHFVVNSVETTTEPSVSK